MTDPKDRAPDAEPSPETVETEAVETEAVETEAAAAADGGELVPEPEPEPDPEALLRAERDDFRDKWMRAAAELDNVRKRARRELVDSRTFARADVLRSFLEIQDHFERALQSLPTAEDTGPVDGVREGVQLIAQRFRGLLRDQGVEAIEALGAPFDPNRHEAVGQLEREGVEPGEVIEIVQQGYSFGDMILRPSRVIISA